MAQVGLSMRVLGAARPEDLTLRHLQRALRAQLRSGYQTDTVTVSVQIRSGLTPVTLLVQPEGPYRGETKEAEVPVTVVIGTSVDQRATLDRAAALLGADYRPFATEARPKDTSEVDGSTQQGDAAHGGDSASGEVPDGESGGAQGQEGALAPCEGGDSDGQSMQAGGTGLGGATTEGANGDPSETGRESTSEPGNAKAQSQSGTAEARTPDGALPANPGQNTADPGRHANGSSVQEVPGGAEPAGPIQDGAHVQAEDADSESAHQPDGGAAGSGCDRQPEDETLLGDSEDGAMGDGAGTPAEGQSSPAEATTTARRAHGGVYAHLTLRAERPLARQVQGILQRLVGDAAEDDGPRMDVRRSMSRLLSRRPDWVVRREEGGRPALLVLVDVSGSCSRFCADAVRIATAVAEQGLQGAEVVVVAHSNGYPEEARCGQRAIPMPSTRWEGAAAVCAWYAQHIAVRDIRHVLVIGDGDGEWLYRDLAHRSAVESVLWLDGWRARVYGLPRATARDQEERRVLLRQAGWSAAALSKMRYVAGCGDVAQFADALRLAIG